MNPTIKILFSFGCAVPAAKALAGVVVLLYVLFAAKHRKRSLELGISNFCIKLKLLISNHQLLSPLFLIAFVLYTTAPNAQQRITFTAAYDTALQNNLKLRSSDLQIQRYRTLSSTWREIPKTGVFAENEDINPADKTGILKIGLSQSIEWFGVYKARRSLLQQQVKSVEFTKQIRALEIKRDVQAIYYSLWYLQSKQFLWQRLDSIYTSLAKAAELKVRTGESAGLDSIAAQAKAKEISVQLQLLSRDIQVQQELFKKYLSTSFNYMPETTSLQKVQIAFLDSSLNAHPQLQFQEQNVTIAQAEINVQKQSRNPSFEGRFFSQRLYGVSNPYSGFSVAMGIPIFGSGAYKNRIRAAEIERNYQQTLLEYERLSLVTSYRQAFQQLQKDQELLSYYESTGLAQAEAILKAANIAYRAGEISFAELSQFLSQAIDIQKNYLDVLNQYNQSAIQLNYFTGISN